jgi:hypothetical protein
MFAWADPERPYNSNNNNKRSASPTWDEYPAKRQQPEWDSYNQKLDKLQASVDKLIDASRKEYQPTQEYEQYDEPEMYQ